MTSALYVSALEIKFVISYSDVMNPNWTLKEAD